MQQIPKFHETFIPILTVLADGNPVPVNAFRKKVQEQFYGDLPAELLTLKTKSGDLLVHNRIGWGKAYLKQAGMVAQPERGYVQITEKGKLTLKKGALSLRELREDPDYQAYQKQVADSSKSDTGGENASPQDLIDLGFSQIEEQVRAELLLKLKSIDPFEFQKVILVLLEKMGYGEFLVTPKSGDGGVDGILKQDALGIDRIYMQAKRYADNKVREGEIRNFIGAMSRDTAKGIFVTTSSFDDKAIQKARDATQKIIMIDGLLLTDLMLKYGVGVQIKSIYEIKEIDEDFFGEE